MASAPWQQSQELGPNKVQVTILASDWGSSKGGLSTIKRELAIRLAKFSEVQVTYFLPKCSEEDRKVALSHGIKILAATRLPGYEELEWLSFPPDHLRIDVIVGHGVKLGRQALVIRNSRKCKWIQMVHTDPEELGMFKCYENLISKGEEKHNVEVELCEMADFIVGVGPKLAEAFRNYLRSCQKQQDVIDFTPGNFDEFVSVQQVREVRKQYSVLVFGRGDAEDFELKGFDIAARSVAALPDTRLLVVGAPDGNREEIANRLLECGIPKRRFRVKGYIESRESLKGLFGTVDLVLMPSRTEGFRLTGLEALSAGLPVIVSKNSGFGEALGNVPFGSAFVIYSEDPNAWTAAIKNIWDKDRQTRLFEAKVLRVSYGMKYSWSEKCSNLLRRIFQTPNESSVPPEILARGPEAVYAFQKALQTGKCKVYRGRIMLLGQDRAGKTSLKKSLLGLPFDPWQESTVGVEVDPSTCEIEVDRVINWTPSKRKKLEESEFEEEIARLIAKDLAQTEANKKNETAAESQFEQVQRSNLEEEVEDQENLEPPSNEPESWSYVDQKSEIAEEVGKSKDEGPVEKSNELELNIDNATVPNNVADLVVHYLQDQRLEDEIKTKEVILTLWDFAGQHLYYAAHSVFLSQRAVYVLVYNLNKNLLAEAKSCCRQGINEILLDNFNNESNLDNLVSWLVSVHSIRSVAGDAHKYFENEKRKLPYLRPPVIIVGTHADQAFEDVKTTEKHIKDRILGKEYAKHVITTYFAVNNTAENDEGVEKLRQKIMEVLNNEPYMGEEVPLRWFYFEKVVQALVARPMYHMDLDQLLPVIKQFCHIDDQDETTAMLNFYHDLGIIVKHGRTVVLQAQWLIDLFKQLITVPPYEEADPLCVNWWKELQDTGILRTALVDYVFADFIEKGLLKQDILEMMELYGLIAKFSSEMSTSENEEEQIYFVPTQLRSSPLGLCEIKPSELDPCPLFVHFLDGFVPHGLFPQFVSRCIGWCSENGFKETPQLFNDGARFLLGKPIICALILICRKRFIKVVLKRAECSLEPSSSNASNKMAIEFRTFMEKTLNGLSQDLSWPSNLRYELSVACTQCQQSGHMLSQHRSQSFGQDDFPHLLQVPPPYGKLICTKNFADKAVTVLGLEKWFELRHSQNEEQKMDLMPLASPGRKKGKKRSMEVRMSSEAVALDPSFSCKSGIPSRDDLLLIAHELGTKWKMLGRVLKVPDPVVEQIKKDNDELSERCYKVLTSWKERSASEATYQRLAKALQHPAVDRKALAVKYCGLRSCKKKRLAKDF
ncbi:uncharacterized protein [Montipora capricornis]|uniref:uncharacterized protein n=1 Tax=Montipora capricornis TaxID=246305 RepID=UPI0035F11C20